MKLKEWQEYLERRVPELYEEGLSKGRIGYMFAIDKHFVEKLLQVD
ncbi:MAG: hypothetical protein ACOCTT_04345 [archaeon]